MPYTCVYRSVTGVLASVALRACSRGGWCRVGGVTGCARGWRARAVGHRGATPGRPGERAAAERSLAQKARVAALLLLTPQRGSLACASDARP